jgi:hypothetical protein
VTTGTGSARMVSRWNQRSTSSGAAPAGTALGIPRGAVASYQAGFYRGRPIVAGCRCERTTGDGLLAMIGVSEKHEEAPLVKASATARASSHGGNTGSNPVGDVNNFNKLRR